MEAEDAAERTVAAGAEGRIQNELTYEKKGRGNPCESSEAWKEHALGTGSTKFFPALCSTPGGFTVFYQITIRLNRREKNILRYIKDGATYLEFICGLKRLMHVICTVTNSAKGEQMQILRDELFLVKEVHSV